MNSLSLNRKEAMAKTALSKQIAEDIQEWLNAGEILLAKTLPSKYEGLLESYEKKFELEVNQIQLEGLTLVGSTATSREGVRSAHPARVLVANEVARL